MISSPWCLNCHPKDERPLQGDDMHPHKPPVERGVGGMGVSGMRCITCHRATNSDPAEVPGHPKWLLAAAEMAWVGQSLGDIYRQIKYPARNGGKSMDEIVEHMARDSLVGWGWHPGAGRTPAPGTQEEFVALIKAWAETGAHCPSRRPRGRETYTRGRPATSRAARDTLAEQSMHTPGQEPARA